MFLTEEDKRQLLKWGHKETDIPQVEEATSKTIYILNDVRISRKEAIQLLGRNNYLSGISRSAFHYTACRVTTDGKSIIFDSHKLFQ